MDPYWSVLKATPNRRWRFVRFLLLAIASCSPTPLNISSNEHLVAKIVKVPFHVCSRLVQSRVGTVVVSNLPTFADHCVLVTQNLCLGPKGNMERSISVSKLHGLSERDHHGGRSTCLTGKEGHGIIRNDHLFRHGKIEVTACKTHERCAAGVQNCSCIKKNVHSLVRMQFLVPHDNQSSPRNVLEDYWVDPATEFVQKSGPLEKETSSNVRLRVAPEALVVGPLLGDNASTRSVGGELSASTTTTMETDIPL